MSVTNIAVALPAEKEPQIDGYLAFCLIEAGQYLAECTVQFAEIKGSAMRGRLGVHQVYSMRKSMRRLKESLEMAEFSLRDK